MRRNAVRDLGISVTATSSFSPRRERILLSQVTSNKQEVLGEETSAQAEAKTVDKPIIKLPVLTQPRRHNKEEKDNLQVVLRGVQCFEFSLEGGLMRELNTSRKNSTPSSDSQGSKHLISSNQEIREDPRETLVCVQDREENMDGDKDKLLVKGYGNVLPGVLPLSASILEGQRLNIRKKGRLNTNRTSMQHYRKPTDKGNKLPYQTDSTSGLENISSKLSETKTTICNVVPLKPCKHQAARPVFRLPTADKYDITPRNIVNRKVCSVFRLNRKSSLLKRDYNDSQRIPQLDSNVIKNSVFRTILQQPAVFLRQPSPVAGVKMNLKEQEDYLVEAIQTVENTNIQTPTVEAEVTRPVKKFVIRLPPIY